MRSSAYSYSVGEGAGPAAEVEEIRLVQESPLVVRFPGAAFQVAPLPHNLEVLDE